MIEIDIEQGLPPQTPEGVNPTHKITVKQGAETSVFWYLQYLNASNPSDPHLDHGLLKQLHSEARGLTVGDFAYLSYGHGKDYHLHRLGRNRFTLKALA